MPWRPTSGGGGSSGGGGGFKGGGGSSGGGGGGGRSYIPPINFKPKPLMPMPNMSAHPLLRPSAGAFNDMGQGGAGNFRNPMAPPQMPPMQNGMMRQPQLPAPFQGGMQQPMPMQQQLQSPQLQAPQAAAQERPPLPIEQGVFTSFIESVRADSSPGLRAALESPFESKSEISTPMAPPPIANQQAPNLKSIPEIYKYAQSVYGDQSNMSKIALAQSILESGIGGSPSKLARNNYNLFGIKGKGTADSEKMMTKEFVNGKMGSYREGFAKNASIEDSFRQHQNLMNKPRYQPVLEAPDFESAARALQSSGYATDPNYANKLISIYKSRILNLGE